MISGRSAGAYVQELTEGTLHIYMRRVILENGERLAAVAAVRGAENRLLGARGGAAAAACLQRVIAAAGAACMPQARLPKAVLLGASCVAQCNTC